MNTDPAHAKELVLVGAIGTGLVSAVGQIGQNSALPSSRIGFGVFIELVMLSLLAEFAPQLASGFAMLGLTTAVFVYGGPAFDALSRITNTTAPATTASSTGD